MIPAMFYDAQDLQKRKEVRRANIFIVSVVFLILVVFSIITSIVVYMLLHLQKDRLEVTFSFLFHLVALSVIIVLFLALLIIPTLGRQSMRVDFFDEFFTVNCTGPFENAVFEIDYQNVEKVYISTISKLRIWHRVVGHYSIYYEIKKEKRNGAFRDYKKRLYRQLPPVYSLKEAEEIVKYIKSQRQRNKKTRGQGDGSPVS